MVDDEAYDQLLETIIDLKIFLYNSFQLKCMQTDFWFRGAALIEKYSDYDGKGVFIFREEETKPRLAKALIRSIQIATHAIGDNG